MPNLYSVNMLIINYFENTVVQKELENFFITLKKKIMLDLNPQFLFLSNFDTSGPDAKVIRKINEKNLLLPCQSFG